MSGRSRRPSSRQRSRRVDPNPDVPSSRARFSRTITVANEAINIQPVGLVSVPQKEVEPDWEPNLRPKKRVVNKDQWKRRKLSLVRRDYQSCGCTRLNCGSKFSEEDIKTIRDHFISIREYADQQTFLFGLVRMKHNRLPSDDDEHAVSRRATFQYFLPCKSSNYTEVRVCFKQFLNMFSINHSRLEKIQDEKRRGLLSPRADQRGKHSNRPNKISAPLRNNIIDHVVEVIQRHGQRSHFLRRHAEGTIYLPHTFSIRAIWEAFLERHQPAFLEEQRQVDQYVIAERSLSPMVTLRRFSDLFNEVFGFIKFRLPKTDECGTCLTFRNHIESLKKNNTDNSIIQLVIR